MFFNRNSNASIPQSRSFSEIMQAQKDLHVPQTAPSMMTPSGISYTVKYNGNRKTYVLDNFTKTWTDAEINGMPEEIIARNDVVRQNAEKQKIIQNLTDEQKRLLSTFV